MVGQICLLKTSQRKIKMYVTLMNKFNWLHKILDFVYLMLKIDHTSLLFKLKHP